jgi:hypothetical protein
MIQKRDILERGNCSLSEGILAVSQEKCGTFVLVFFNMLKSYLLGMCWRTVELRIPGEAFGAFSTRFR